MTVKAPAVNQKIMVSRKNQQEWYNSTVQDINSDYISIAMPYHRERPLVLQRDEELLVRFSSEHSSYSFTTRVVGAATDNIIMYKLAYPDQISRIQQRMHVRLPVMIDVEYATKDKDKTVDKNSRPKTGYKKGTTVDISAGGMKLAVREKIENGVRLALVFTLPISNRPELFEFESIVQRAVKADPDREVYHLGVKFLNVTYSQEDKIVRYIFEKMAQQKRLR